MGELAVTTTTALPGRTKAAIMLLSLGTERAAQVMRHLEKDEVEQIAVEMARTGRVDPGTAWAIAEEALGDARPDGFAIEGGLDSARDVLERSLGGERAAGI